MTVASRVAVMDEGRIVQVATPAEIYEAPNSVYVADFIGDVNLIHGRASARKSAATGPDDTGDGLQIAWAEGQPPVAAANGSADMAGRDVVLALRPEKVTISKDPLDTVNAIQGTVIDIAYLGNISTYHVEIAGGVMIKAQIANTRRISRRDITWEDSVWVGFSATAGVVLAE